MLVKSLGSEQGLLTKRFGLSEIRSDTELEYGIADFKEPDLLVYEIAHLDDSQRRILEQKDLVAESRAAFRPGETLSFVTGKAAVAIEVEFSPYRAAEMAGRNWTPKTREQWDRRPLKNANPPIAPNIWVKQEDLGLLLRWERVSKVPIVVLHVFDQEAFAVPLRMIADFQRRLNKMPAETAKLQVTTGIFTKIQAYDRADAQGAGERKPVFIVSPAASVKAGDIIGVEVATQLGISSSKKYVSHVIFSGGKLAISPDFLELIRRLAPQRRGRA
ncbi:MAG TPA: hypothetical protein VN661_10105 [Candidatus Acidoferrales bacterium]|nr:hypothetical protein [Candidatus Acidoferrales bacterium]